MIVIPSSSSASLQPSGCCRLPTDACLHASLIALDDDLLHEFHNNRRQLIIMMRHIKQFHLLFNLKKLYV